MISHGKAPFLECSTDGDKRFPAFCARIEGRESKTIERIYQQAKVFADGSTRLSMWQAKGKRAVNQVEVHALYEQLWREYMTENPQFLPVLLQASGLSDKFGKPGHSCQATVLWQIRNEYYKKDDKVILTCNIWDDGADGHHPPGYLAMKGDLVVIRRAASSLGLLAVSHEGRLDASFSVYFSEVRPHGK